jgi:anti-sigma28 factor (negative regulator of flagellin synthesis)
LGCSNQTDEEMAKSEAASETRYDLIICSDFEEYLKEYAVDYPEMILEKVAEIMEKIKKGEIIVENYEGFET